MGLTIQLAVMLALFYGGVVVGRRPDTRQGMASALLILLPVVAVALLFAGVAVGSAGGWVLAALGVLTAGVFVGSVAE
jgi:hypothetical protein